MSTPVIRMEIPEGSVLGRILSERRRQMAKGFTPEHDDTHAKSELALSVLFRIAGMHSVSQYPLGQFWTGWKWKEYQGEETQLVEAAALIIAELERRERARVCKCSGFDKGIISADCPEHGEAVQKARLHEFAQSMIAEPWSGKGVPLCGDEAVGGWADKNAQLSELGKSDHPRKFSPEAQPYHPEESEL